MALGILQIGQSTVEKTDLRVLLTVEDQKLRTKRWERLCAKLEFSQGHYTTTSLWRNGL